MSYLWILPGITIIGKHLLFLDHTYWAHLQASTFLSCYNIIIYTSALIIIYIYFPMHFTTAITNYKNYFFCKFLRITFNVPTLSISNTYFDMF